MNANEKLPMIEVKVGYAMSCAYARSRIDGKLSRTQAAVARDLLLYLTQQQARLKDGRYVERPMDVFRWFLEQVEGQLTEKPAIV